jgi:hypothetical protein
MRAFAAAVIRFFGSSTNRPGYSRLLHVPTAVNFRKLCLAIGTVTADCGRPFSQQLALRLFRDAQQRQLLLVDVTLDHFAGDKGHRRPGPLLADDVEQPNRFDSQPRLSV